GSGRPRNRQPSACKARPVLRRRAVARRSGRCSSCPASARRAFSRFSLRGPRCVVFWRKGDSRAHYVSTFRGFGVGARFAVLPASDDVSTFPRFDKTEIEFINRWRFIAGLLRMCRSGPALHAWRKFPDKRTVCPYRGRARPHASCVTSRGGPRPLSTRSPEGG